MQVTVTTDDGGVFPLDISDDVTLQDLQALLEMETSISRSELLLVHNTAPMIEVERTLGQYGVAEGDIIMASRVVGGVAGIQSTPPPPPVPPSASASSNSSLAIDWGVINLTSSATNEQGQAPSTTSGAGHQQRQQAPPRDPNDPETIRQHFLNNPYELSRLQQQNPPLAEALLSGNRERFRDALDRQQRVVREGERERIRMLNADPLDPEYQEKIARDIQKKNIEENMEAAIEYTPESFSRVVMLYLDIKVNGVPVKALVDSGARSTVMSKACAERCNIMRLVDQRFSGMAFGVGQQRIIGRVHLGQIQIGKDFLTSSFQVLETAAEDMLLGLDMLRRHHCCIDLKDNCLRIGSTGSTALFLTEKDLKEKEEMEKKQLEATLQAEEGEVANAIVESEEEKAADPSHSTLSSSSSSQPPTSSSSSSSSSSTFPEEDIHKITSAGFSHEEAVQELHRNHGNVQQALAALFARSLKF